MKLIKLYILLCISAISFAQQTPADKQTKAITITGATAHIGNGEVIENAFIVIENGKITTINNATVSQGTKGDVIDATGKHVYPGFIAPNATLGLAEIDAVRATRDVNEVGIYNPHVRSLIAYNAESKVVESMRPNGVLIGQITPRGGTVSGTSSVVQFDAWNWEDAVIKENDGVHLNWPSQFAASSWKFAGGKYNKVDEKYAEKVTKLKNYFTKAQAYSKTNKTNHLPFEGMRGVFNGNKKLYIHANPEQSILDAINFANSFGIKNLVIVGGYDTDKVIPTLKQYNVAVLLRRVHSLPNSDDDDYDKPYKLAKVLTDNGVLVALESSGGMERMNTRNLPFYAGTVAAQGLDKEKALQLITGNTAKILDINDKYGTLEEGKSATLFISKGDALDMRGNQIEKAFIDGRDISLETHQTKLWKRYSKKYSK